MKARAAVDMPHRFVTLNWRTVESASTRGGFGEDAQRGSSTEGPATFRGRFRIESTRLPGWDYTSNGYYFVTICTRDRVPLLGEILDGSVRLTRIGEIVAQEWQGMAIRRRDVSLDEWVVMPNHLHGIVVIARERNVETPQRKRALGVIPDDRHVPDDRPVRQVQRGVSTASRLQAGALGAIAGQFKSRSTKRLWGADFRDFGWQPRFYDHVIRDDTSSIISVSTSSTTGELEPRGDDAGEPLDLGAPE